jgi:HAD superfamily hydrolase (TIGR01490 family)
VNIEAVTRGAAGPPGGNDAKKECERAIAIFDLDGTLTRRDTFLAYLHFVLKRRIARLAQCARLPWSVLLYQSGLRPRDWLKQDFVAAVLGGCSRAEVNAHTAAFIGQFGPGLIKPAALEVLRWHQSQSHRLMIASASLDIYALRLGTLWGVPEGVCTQVKWEADRITGMLDGPNLRGEAKLTAVKDALGLTAGDRPEIFAYSDHHSDLPLLKFADYGFAVDPTTALANCAPGEGIRILRWTRRASRSSSSAQSRLQA